MMLALMLMNRKLKSTNTLDFLKNTLPLVTLGTKLLELSRGRETKRKLDQ